MSGPFPQDRDRITIAILALGGQGGGVLADWILDTANANGWTAQGTSVPGVAQRTGSTVYYIEMVRKGAAGANRTDPVLAMMPVPGDVDVVVASELMEAGRAILRGFVSAERTTLIGSTHRIYAISEKAAMGNGLGSSERILDAAERRAKRFIGFDMDAASARSGAAISAIMLGALAGSDVLPFERDAFEAAIRHGGKAVAANLKGFEEGAARARSRVDEVEAALQPPEPTTAAGAELSARIAATLPPAAHRFAIEGVRRLMDYQDRAYAAFYLDRLDAIRALDSGQDDFRLTREAARHLALWMSYEDTIRVADLKVRATRMDRVEKDVLLGEDQLMTLTEYMHPRLQEVCETMPAWLGNAILSRPGLCRRLQPFFEKGRHVQTTSLRWFLMLCMLSGMRRWRRSTLRYIHEQERIEGWLDKVRRVAATDVALAAEIVATQRLIKGYGDTFERGLSRFNAVVDAAVPLAGAPDAVEWIRRLRDAALADESGAALAGAMEQLPPARVQENA